MSEETAVIDQWIEDSLLGTASWVALMDDRVFLEKAPVGTPYPFTVYQLQAPTDLRVVGGTRVWSDCLYVVRAVANTKTYRDLSECASAIEEALTTSTGATVASPSGEVFEAFRESPYRLPEEAAGKTFLHLGGLYRIRAIGA